MARKPNYGSKQTKKTVNGLWKTVFKFSFKRTKRRKGWRL